MIARGRLSVPRLILPALLASSAWTAYRVDAQSRSFPAPLNIPLVAGLVTVGAVREPDKGDDGSILTVDSLSADAVGHPEGVCQPTLASVSSSPAKRAFAACARAGHARRLRERRCLEVELEHGFERRGIST